MNKPIGCTKCGGNGHNTDECKRFAGELWAVHAQGPDDIYPAFDRADAERHATELNAIQTPPGISVGAVVIPSPMSPLEHWKELAEQEREHKAQVIARAAQPAPVVPEGWRVFLSTADCLRDGDRWEVYGPKGGGIVSTHDVRDWTVRELLDALAAAPAQGQQAGQKPVEAVHLGWDYLDDRTKVATYFVPCPGDTPPKLYTEPKPAPDQDVAEDWSVFIGYLIDKCEGHEISEERLQFWLRDMLDDPHYGALLRREKELAEQPSAIALSIEAAEEEHGSLRAAAKALDVDHGYLSRLKNGDKSNPSDELLAKLGLERLVIYRTAAHDKQIGEVMLEAAPQPAPAQDVAGLVEAASGALAEIQAVMQEAYNSATPVCCGRGISECCGSPDPEWSEHDQRTMDRFAPHELALRAALADLDKQSGEVKP